jgi:hypothetical protein
LYAGFVHTEIVVSAMSVGGRGTMKKITLSADERLIEAARERARAEHTTLNEEFRRWLAGYAGAQRRLRRYDEVMAQLRGQWVVGRKLTRDEMNER